jgi:hypothetical protein
LYAAVSQAMFTKSIVRCEASPPETSRPVS